MENGWSAAEARRLAVESRSNIPEPLLAPMISPAEGRTGLEVDVLVVAALGPPARPGKKSAFLECNPPPDVPGDGIFDGDTLRGDMSTDGDDGNRPPRGTDEDSIADDDE